MLQVGHTYRDKCNELLSVTLSRHGNHGVSPGHYKNEMNGESRRVYY
jgi:hypothetical protein